MPYVPGANDPVSQIRWQLQDTDNAAPELQDSEIQAEFDRTDATQPQSQRVTRAALALAQLLLRRYSRQYDYVAGDARYSLSQRVGSWRAVVADLEAQVDALDHPAEAELGVIYVRRSDA